MDSFEKKREVNFLIVIFTFMYPLAVSWILLRKGYSTLSRITVFTWTALYSISALLIDKSFTNFILIQLLIGPIILIFVYIADKIEGQKNKKIKEKNDKITKIFEEKFRNIHLLSKRIESKISTKFLVQSCPRCFESDMKLIEISPNSRSIEYQCLHCSKKLRSVAGSPSSEDVKLLLDKLDMEIFNFNYEFPHNKIDSIIKFSTPVSPLPYQQTKREPITEAIRTEVWRRDKGMCVKCGSKQNLEFDHIIPVSKGGATTARNIQLLCKQCNLSKSNTI